MNNFRNSRNRRASGIFQTAASVQTAVPAPLAIGASSPHSDIDLWFQRVAHLSQLALVLLATFGYVYTVLPVYQKSLLDEEIAKKTLELRAMERNVSDKETLLASRIDELKLMSGSINELKGVAANARKSQGQAQVEVEKLRGIVESQYAGLRYWLIRDLREDVLRACKMNNSNDIGFADCLQKRVQDFLSSDRMLSPDDRTRLLLIVQTKLPGIQRATAEFWTINERRKAEVELQAKHANVRCAQFKSMQDYKDPIKRVSIDSQCSLEQNGINRDLAQIKLDESSSNQKVLLSPILEIMGEFLNRKL